MRDRAPRSWPSIAAKPSERAAQALKRLEDITRLVSDWVWETDAKHRLTFVSERGFEILGVPAIQFVGKTFDEIGSFSSDRHTHPFQSTPTPFRDRPYTIKNQGGQTRHLLMSGVPFYGKDRGDFLGIRGTARDVTDLVAMEQIKRAQEERQRAFVADVAHELRTPLGLLRARLDTMENEPVRNELRQEIDGISRILSQMLAFARYEHLQLLGDQLVDLRDVAAQVVAQLGPIAIAESREVEVVYDEGQDFRVAGEQGALEQAIRNLVENAIRYSRRESTITIRLGKGPSIHVINEGISIPENLRDTIFDRFERADRRGGGVGIGLSIVKRIAEAHKARITLEDVEGGGCDFGLTWATSGRATPGRATSGSTPA